MINRFLLYLFVCLPVCAAMPWSASAVSQDNRCSILVLGDSLSAAYGMSTTQGWVALLNVRLKHHGYLCSIVNASVSGDTTQGGKARLPSLLKQYKPSHLILELGANNGLRALPTKMMEKDLRGMIQIAKASQVDVLLVGLRMPPNYGPIYTSQFAEVYDSLAKKEDIAFVPFFLEGVITNPEWMQVDAMHPNAEGQLRLLDNIWSKLLGILPKSP